MTENYIATERFPEKRQQVLFRDSIGKLGETIYSFYPDFLDLNKKIEKQRQKIGKIDPEERVIDREEAKLDKLISQRDRIQKMRDAFEAVEKTSHALKGDVFKNEDGEWSAEVAQAETKMEVRINGDASDAFKEKVGEWLTEVNPEVKGA